MWVCGCVCVTAVLRMCVCVCVCVCLSDSRGTSTGPSCSTTDSKRAITHSPTRPVNLDLWSASGTTSGTASPHSARPTQCMFIRKDTSDRVMHRIITSDRVDASEDDVVDFSNASLYLSAIQTIVSVLACACTSILACWLIPTTMVSAVRTLTLTSLVGAFMMHKPLRIGKVHGLTVVFGSLRPAVAVYIMCLVLETLLHTCTQDTDDVPSWRRIVFQGAVVVMIGSGMMRARSPLSETDRPFLLTSLSLLLVAFLPPPAVSMQGPLCQSVSFLGAVERIVRALVFSSVYALFVFISSPNNSQYGGTVVCIMRASAASVWVLGAAPPLLLFAIPQCSLAIWARLRAGEEEEEEEEEEEGSRDGTARDGTGKDGFVVDRKHLRYNQLATRTPPPETSEVDDENDDDNTDALQLTTTKSVRQPSTLAPISARSDLSERTSHNGMSFAAHSGPLPMTVGPLVFKSVGLPACSAGAAVSKERMQEIAASIHDP